MRSYLVFDCLLNAALHGRYLDEVPEAVASFRQMNADQQRTFRANMVRVARQETEEAVAKLRAFLVEQGIGGSDTLQEDGGS